MSLRFTQRFARQAGMPGPGRLLGLFLVMLLLIACAPREELPELPEVPPFESLGFADALDSVHQQMRGVYEKWQENPLDAGRNGRLGMHLSVYGKLDAAEVLYQRARTLAPGELRWTYYLAHTLYELGRHDDAAGMFREVLKLDPGIANARLQLAKILLESDNIEESRTLYQAFTVEFPERIEGWLGLGKTFSRTGDNDAAAAALRRALELGPQYGEIHYALAFVLREMGDVDGATRELAAYERNARNVIRTEDSLIRVITKLYVGDARHYEMAVYQYGRARYDKAAESFRAVVTVNPANVDAWAGLVSAQAKHGAIDKAGETYREALAAGVAYARLHLTYGQALIDEQQLDAAHDAIGQALVLDPQYAKALSAMGELEMQRGESLAAVEQFRRLLLARPSDPRVQLSLAEALNATGQFSEAAGLLEPITTDPAVDRPLALKELALAYRGMDRTDEAIDTLLRSREAVLETNNPPLEGTIDLLLAEWQKEPAE